MNIEIKQPSQKKSLPPRGVTIGLCLLFMFIYTEFKIETETKLKLQNKINHTLLQFTTAAAKCYTPQIQSCSFILKLSTVNEIKLNDFTKFTY